jgi:hypothetical protein
MRTFWHAHLDWWKRSDLNQGEYCEFHGTVAEEFRHPMDELGVQNYRRHAP